MKIIRHSLSCIPCLVICQLELFCILVSCKKIARVCGLFLSSRFKVRPNSCDAFLLVVSDTFVQLHLVESWSLRITSTAYFEEDLKTNVFNKSTANLVHKLLEKWVLISKYRESLIDEFIDRGSKPEA